MAKNKQKQRIFKCEHDAYYWAQEFCKKYPQMDQATMVGWFANAQMASYDLLKKRQK